MAERSFRSPAAPGPPMNNPWSRRTPNLGETDQITFEGSFHPPPHTRLPLPYLPESASAAAFNSPIGTNGTNAGLGGVLGRPASGLASPSTSLGQMTPISATAPFMPPQLSSNLPPTGRATDSSPGPAFGASFPGQGLNLNVWERNSPQDLVDTILGSPNLSLSDYGFDGGPSSTSPTRPQPRANGKATGQRRPSNRDEFDGPHQFLQRPPPEYVAIQERELPHLPTNLLVHEQDAVLGTVNDRLSRCAFDFIAKYQFPIPLTQDMRPVEHPRDREWTEWVYLLKRLATKRRIPARVLYNGQIKQFVTILENSIEMRHASKHQSRPLKDDRNILQLISAGIQVAKIVKDASAMDFLDRLYVQTEEKIHERASLSRRVMV